MFICSHCGEISSTGGLRRAANAKAWALGNQIANGFHIRRIVWGLMMANAEKRIDEEIRAVLLVVEPVKKRRTNPMPRHPRSKEPPMIKRTSANPNRYVTPQSPDKRFVRPRWKAQEIGGRCRGTKAGELAKIVLREVKA